MNAVSAAPGNRPGNSRPEDGNVLKTRILTALIIFPVTLALVFLAPPLVFRVAIAVLMMIGCWEFRRLAGLSAGAGWLLMAVQFALLALMLIYWEPVQQYSTHLLAAGCAAWLLMFTRLAGYHAGSTPGTAYRITGFLSALVSLSVCWFALCWLQARDLGAFVLFLLLLIIWASDIGAYFSGKNFGKHKLAPVISPNKTWEGVYGGFALALVVAFLWSGPIAGLGIEPVALVVNTLLTACTSVGGDLFISIHKRTVKLADAGSLFPGHGGVLDRYDSLLSGAPFFALAFRLLA